VFNPHQASSTYPLGLTPIVAKAALIETQCGIARHQEE